MKKIAALLLLFITLTSFKLNDGYPCHPLGDLYPCTHAMHPLGDLGVCTHTFINPYGYLCYYHPNGDLYSCTHPAHPAGDIGACTHVCW